MIGLPIQRRVIGHQLKEARDCFYIRLQTRYEIICYLSSRCYLFQHLGPSFTIKDDFISKFDFLIQVNLSHARMSYLKSVFASQTLCRRETNSVHVCFFHITRRRQREVIINRTNTCMTSVIMWINMHQQLSITKSQTSILSGFDPDG